MVEYSYDAKVIAEARPLFAGDFSDHLENVLNHFARRFLYSWIENSQFGNERKFSTFKKKRTDTLKAAQTALAQLSARGETEYSTETAAQLKDAIKVSTSQRWVSCKQMEAEFIVSIWQIRFNSAYGAHQDGAVYPADTNKDYLWTATLVDPVFLKLDIAMLSADRFSSVARRWKDEFLKNSPPR
ncbi:hypothetical protein [Ahrensia marina]|uniref:Uncharacterized protein n=1 Tax=Ahrensia marina TaxID=1514904 RepID=A0A0N0E7N0_9HYPH|nr:hypothetical protein [Ahrensia marina]KPB01375.1 hypothetical protein SU32_09000 [Ahrensia marina]